jgi:hypothetical protein
MHCRVRLRLRAGAEELDRLAFRELGHRVLALAPDSKQLPTRSEEREVGAALDERSELGRNRDHLLEVVEQKQQLELTDVLGQSVFGPERLRNRLGDKHWISDRREADPEDARAEFRDEACRGLDPQTRLARATGPVSVSRRAPSRRSEETSSTSFSLPTKELAGRGRFVLEIVLSGGKDSDPSWKIQTGCAKSLSRCSPRSKTSYSTSSRVSFESRTWPPCPAAAIRAARWTSGPT